MKLYLHLLLPAVLTLACTEGSKFKGAAASATVEKTYEEPSENATPSEDVPDVEPSPVAEPTVKITKLGINFEDTLSTDADNDYNDAVLCFEGGFDYAEASTTITSSKEQEVMVKTFSASGCKHDITAEVVKSDGSIRSSKTFSSKDGDDFPLIFKKGDKLEVYMKPLAGETQCSPDVKRDMHNTNYAKTLPDECNNTGN